MKKNLALIVAALVVIGGITYLMSTRGDGAGKVRIAVNLPLSGPIAAFMEPYPSGLKMGLEEGASSESLAPDFFRLDVQDNGGKPSQAVTVLQQQSLRGFDVYVSGSTEMSMAIIDEVDRTRRPHFLIAFDAFMTGRGPDRLRVLPSYKLEGPLWVEYAKMREARRIFMITLNNAPIEEEFTAIVEPGVRGIGAEFRRERFEWTGSDYRALALLAQEFKPDLIMVNGYSVHLYPVIAALRALGLVNDGNVVAALDFVDLLYTDTPKTELQGVAFVCPMFEVPGAISENADWRARYEARFGKRPSYVAAYAYDTGRLIARGVVRSFPPAKVDLLASVPFEGASGEVRLDAEGDLASTLTIAILDKDGRVVNLRK
jgi:ABC-type branched-subunit amino acid transport system substrate-binding protein